MAERIAKFEELQREFDLLFPRIVALLRGRATEVMDYQRLCVIRDICFDKAPHEELAERHKLSSVDMVRHYKHEGLHVVFELLTNGEIEISEELRNYLNLPANFPHYINRLEDMRKTCAEETPETIKDKIRTKVERTLKKLSTRAVPCDEKDIEEVMGKMASANIRNIRDIQNFAYLAARSVFFDKREHEDSERRAREARIKEETREDEKRVLFEAAQEEFARLMENYRTRRERATSDDDRKAADMQLAYLETLRHKRFSRMPTDDIVRTTGGISRGQIYQRARRGRNLVWQNASPNLRNHLGGWQSASRRKKQ